MCLRKVLFRSFISLTQMRKVAFVELKYLSHRLTQSLHEAISDLVFNQPLR